MWGAGLGLREYGEAEKVHAGQRLPPSHTRSDIGMSEAKKGDRTGQKGGAILAGLGEG